MAEWAPAAQAPEQETGSQGPGLAQPPTGPEWPPPLALPGPTGEAASPWTLVAAVQAVEGKVDSLAGRLLSLEGRTRAAERKVFACEKTELEFGNQLESKWAALGTLAQEYGQLRRRLENVENLLRNRNFWILRLPPAVNTDAPKVPATFDEGATFSPEEWGHLEEWQKELYKNVMRSNYEYLVSLDDAISKPDVLSRVEQGEEPCAHEDGQPGAEGREAPADPTPGPPSFTSGIASQIKQEPWAEEEEEEEEGEEEEEARGMDADGGTAGSWLVDPKARPSEEPEPHWAWPDRPEDGLLDQEVNGGGSHGPGPAQAWGSREQRAAGAPEGGSAWPEGRAAAGLPPQGSPEGPFLCAECGRGFSRKERLAQHRQAHAGGERPYACLECGKAFVHQSSLSAHLRTHTGEKPYLCATCLKRFTRLSTLLEHQRTHTGEKPYACAECEKRFTRLSTLVEHRRTHTGEKPYQCARCHKSFTRLTNLTVHQSTHAGERAYSCTRCGKSFPERACFVKHLRGHARERPHQCPDCAKTFPCRSGLVRHQMGHAGQPLPQEPLPCSPPSGERPHQCLACGKAFRCQQGLRLHRRTHARPSPGPPTGSPVSSVKMEDVG